MISPKQIETLLDLGEKLDRERQRLSGLQMLQSVELPQRIAALELRAEADELAALKEMRLELDRQSLMPKRILKSQNKIEALQTDILRLTGELLNQIRRLANETSRSDWFEHSPTDPKCYGEVALLPKRIARYCQLFAEKLPVREAFPIVIHLGEAEERGN